MVFLFETHDSHHRRWRQNRQNLSRHSLFECMPAFPLSHACIVTDKLQQISPFDRLRTPLWVGEVQWRRGAKHATTRVRSHPPSTPSPRDAFSPIPHLQALY